jgi:multidrug efflux pump subunit AcrA (membrane-fusion protein)
MEPARNGAASNGRRPARAGFAARWRVPAAVGLAAAAAMAAYAAGFARPRLDVPTAVVTRGEFVELVELRGDIRPVRSVILGAPTQSGDLQIVKLVKNGTPVRAGDVVIEFDPTSLLRQQTDRRAELKQAEAETERARAEARIDEEDSATGVMRARFDVNRARLDVVERDFVARIDIERAKLALIDAEQRLKEAEKRQVAEAAAASADIARRVRRQSRIQQDLDRLDKALASLVVRAPSAGTASLMPNSRWGGGPRGGAQDFREGDRAWPGAAIVELPDLSSVHLTARLEEADRGRVAMGQSAMVHLDAVPERPYRSKVSKISLLARVDFASAWPPARDFDIELEMADADARLKPGMTATVRIAVGRLPDALLVPAQAVTLVNGQPTVYVLDGSRFEARPVVIAKRGREQLALQSGVGAGERIALANPAAQTGGTRR